MHSARSNDTTEEGVSGLSGPPQAREQESGRQAAREGVPQGFPLREAKEIVNDLFAPKPWLYWTDFLISASIAYGCAAIYLTAPAFSPAQIAAFMVSGFALFRVGTFIHEIVHMQRGSMVGFRIAWNLVVGVPLLMNSLLYGNHLDHHNPRKYGTPADGEYLPLAASPLRETLLYLAQIPLLPVLAVARFLLLVPLSFLLPGLRRWLLKRASSYGSNPYYRRPTPPAERDGLWALMDALSFSFLLTVLVLVLQGVISWSTMGLVYLLATYAIGLNWVRTLAAHRYQNAGTEMTYAQQLQDSLTIGGRSPLTPLLFPVGLRYHALHHLFPSLPYHALREAHRRLLARLPEDSPYRQTICPGFGAAFRELARSALRAGQRGEDPMPLWRGAKAET